MILQLKRGYLNGEYFRKKFGADIIEQWSDAWSEYEQDGLCTMDRESDRIQLTRDGLLRVDSLLPAFGMVMFYGLFSHFLVAFCIVTVYVLASRALPVLRKQWLPCGLAFGAAAYFVMTWLVVPMSNAGNGTITFALPAAPIMTNGILIHMFGVGLPAAYFASKVR